MENKNKTMETRMIGLVLAFALLSMSLVFALHPDGPDDIDIGTSVKKANLSARMVNTSGGTITPVNISSVVINPRWKAFVGNVSGTFVLSDASGNKIYDWAIGTVQGVVFASRENGTGAIKWDSDSIKCATVGEINTEMSAMAHTNPNDNISATFNGTDRGNHDAFYVGDQQITANKCNFTINTYSADNASHDGTFEEVILSDNEGGDEDIIYAAIIEQNAIGYNRNSYDFQIMVPERGSQGFTGKTAYYLYVQLV
jgi:hypothetical protein